MLSTRFSSPSESVWSHPAKTCYAPVNNGRAGIRMTDSFLQRIAAGDESAIGPCMNHYGGLVSSLARRFIPPSEIEDAVQDIFVELWKKAERYSPEKAAESTFIAMVARRRLIDRVRSNARKPRHQTINTETPFQIEGPSSEQVSEDMREDLDRAQAAIEMLSDQQRLVIRLAFRDGKSHQEIADATGIALGSVKTHIRRGMIKLRELISEQRQAQGVTT